MAKASSPQLEELGKALAVMRLLMSEEEFTEAVKLAKGRLNLTPEKAALILVRLANPDELLGQGEEAVLRGVRNETLKKHKDEKLLPHFVNGN